MADKDARSWGGWAVSVLVGAAMGLLAIAAGGCGSGHGQARRPV